MMGLESFMRVLLLSTLLMTGLACRQPGSQPAPPAAPGPRLVLHFTDGDAVLPLADTPPGGSWAVMNTGLWENLSIQWKADGGDCPMSRTSPSWLLLKDPAGKVHRLVLHGPGPGQVREHDNAYPRLDPDRDVRGWGGLTWVWKRR